jgi:hypothetical protein
MASYKFSVIRNLNIYNVIEKTAEFFLRESKSSEKKAVEEDCWAITQATGRSCCG